MLSESNLTTAKITEKDDPKNLLLNSAVNGLKQKVYVNKARSLMKQNKSHKNLKNQQLLKRLKK